MNKYTVGLLIALAASLVSSALVALTSFFFPINYWVFFLICFGYTIIIIYGNRFAKGIMASIALVLAVLVPLISFWSLGLVWWRILVASLIVWILPSMISRMLVNGWVLIQYAMLSKDTDETLRKADDILKKSNKKMTEIEKELKRIQNRPK